MVEYPALFRDHWGYKHLVMNDQELLKFWEWDVLQDEIQDWISMDDEEIDGWAKRTANDLRAAFEQYETNPTIDTIKRIIDIYTASDLSDDGVRRCRDLVVYS